VEKTVEKTVKTLYLLPCECGSHMPVGLAQAGQTVRCRCGRPLAVPTLLGIKALEMAEPGDNHPEPASEWGARHRVILIGIVVVLASTAMLALFHRGKPDPPAKVLETDIVERHTESLTLIQTFAVWEALRQGLSTKRDIDQYYELRLAAYHRRMGITAVFLALGIVTVVVGFFIPKSVRLVDELDDVDETDDTGDTDTPDGASRRE
jgi:hypothetical protein